MSLGGEGNWRAPGPLIRRRKMGSEQYLHTFKSSPGSTKPTPTSHHPPLTVAGQVWHTTAFRSQTSRIYSQKLPSASVGPEPVSSPAGCLSSHSAPTSPSSVPLGLLRSLPMPWKCFPSPHPHVQAPAYTQAGSTGCHVCNHGSRHRRQRERTGIQLTYKLSWKSPAWATLPVPFVLPWCHDFLSLSLRQSQ